MNTPHRLRKTLGLHLTTTTGVVAFLDSTDSVIRFGQDDQQRRTIPRISLHPPTNAEDLQQTVAFLQQLRAVLAQTLDDRRYVLDSAVLTTPLALSDDQAESLRQAATQAGFEVAEVVPEPVAVAGFYAWACGHEDAFYLVHLFGEELFTAAVVRKQQDAWTLLGAGQEPVSGNVLNPTKWERILECCRETLRSAGVGLANIDYVLLAGASPHLSAIQPAVRAAFCDASLPEHTIHPEPLLHEPECCAAAGAALRGARLGTHYLLGDSVGPSADLHLTSPLNTRVPAYQLTGVLHGKPPLPLGSSVLVQALASGLVEEAFLDDQGVFTQPLELVEESDNGFLLTLCDDLGRDLATLPATVRHRSQSRQLGQTVAATELVTRTLQIEVLDQRRQRVKQTLAPVGATLPGTFACVCRTRDQAGRVVVPLFEDNRLLKRIVVGDLDPTLPVGVPVEIELQVDAAHAMRLKVMVRHAGRSETVVLAATAPPKLPTRPEIDALQKDIETHLAQFTGIFHTRHREQLTQLLQAVTEALERGYELVALQHMAALRDLQQMIQGARAQVLEPPWQRFAQLVRQCLIQAGSVADRTGRSREELFEQVYAQERYAEQAFAEQNQTLYRECFENLSKFAAYLDQLGNDFSPAASRGPRRLPTAQEVRREARQLEQELQALLQRVLAQRRTDLQERLEMVQQSIRGLDDRAGRDPGGCVRDLQRWRELVTRIEQELTGVRLDAPDDDEGMLEGTAEAR